MGIRDGLPSDEEDQGAARERFHHGREARRNRGAVYYGAIRLTATRSLKAPAGVWKDRKFAPIRWSRAKCREPDRLFARPRSAASPSSISTGSRIPSGEISTAIAWRCASGPFDRRRY